MKWLPAALLWALFTQNHFATYHPDVEHIRVWSSVSLGTAAALSTAAPILYRRRSQGYYAGGWARQYSTGSRALGPFNKGVVARNPWLYPRGIKHGGVADR